MKQLRVGLVVLAVIAGGAMVVLYGSSPGAALGAGLAGGVALVLAVLVSNPLAGAVAASVMGVLVSAYLAMQHHRAMYGADSACNINETFNCDLVNTSQYSEIGGIPIALLGVAFYAGVAAVAAMGWQDRPGHKGAGSAVLVAGVLASLYSLFLMWASTQVGAWCILCISTYALNAVVLAAGFMASKGAGLAPLMAKGDKSLSTMGTVGVALLVIGVFAYRNLATPPSPEELGYEALYEPLAREVPLTGKEPVWGRPDATYLLVEFADYECPHCALMAEQVKPLVAAHPELKVMHKHYPLSSDCNPNMGIPMHPNACHAARAAWCAGQQGRFWELNAKMFGNQGYLSLEDISFMASQLGLDVPTLEACVASQAAADAVSADIAAAEAVGVDSTPSLYVKDLVTPGGWVKITQGSEGLDLLLKAKAEGKDISGKGGAAP